MAEYSVSQLAELAGVSVRTLRYYDQIGLLRPARRTSGGYRRYGRAELLRLQQILLYRELELPLAEIAAMLDRHDFDPLQALRQHRASLEQRRGRLERIITTVDHTISALTTEEPMSFSDEELYAGLTPEQAERYPREARQLWGEERVSETENTLRKLSKQEWKRIRQQGEDATQAMAALVGRPADDEEVQAAIALHHAWIENFYPVPADVYRGLGRMYVEHPEFRAFYESRAEGLAEFMRAAIELYCERTLT
ncbi:MAG: MerR family transcriptional regulator [Anaerolineales bacterium]|jgi:DNA-binding transcriptional MerR regulator